MVFACRIEIETLHVQSHIVFACRIKIETLNVQKQNKKKLFDKVLLVVTYIILVVVASIIGHSSKTLT